LFTFKASARIRAPSLPSPVATISPICFILSNSSGQHILCV
jgi:hypothetical protein